MSSYLVLGQVATAAAATDYDVYTGASTTSGTVISSIVVCNTNAATATYQIKVRVAGAATTTKQYLVYNATLPTGATDVYTIGVTLADTDVLTVQSNQTGVVFQAFGQKS